MPAKIELRVGEKYTFRLKGQGAAGYNWEYSIQETGASVSVTSEFTDNGKKTRPLPPGISLDMLVTIHALEPGHATVHFALRRSWETGKPSLKEHEIEIFVKR